MKSPLYEFVGLLVHETEKAILVNHGDEDSVWIPKSVCEFTQNLDGKTITVTMSQAMAEDKGIV